MKSRYRIALLVGLLVSPVLLIVGGREFAIFKLYGPYERRISPDDSKPSYAVAFNQGALHGWSEYLGVLDANKAGADLVVVGPLRFVDIPLSCSRIVISSDRSVVAAESLLNRGRESCPYWLAYDFARSVRYGGGRDPTDEDPNLTEARTRAIQDLIQSRGGIGRDFETHDLKRVKLSWLAWRRWQAKVDKAMAECRPWDPCETSAHRQ